MYNVQPFRVYYKAGIHPGAGQVEDGQPHDFSFLIRQLNYSEGVAFQAVYKPARDKAPYEYAEEQRTELLQAIAAEEARRVEIMRQAKESGTPADPAQRGPPKELTEAFSTVFAARLEANRVFCEAVPKGWFREVFRDYVSGVDGLSINGEPKTTGIDLYDVADERLVHLVLQLVNQRTALTAAEGKASSSPSTSPQGDATAAGE